MERVPLSSRPYCHGKQLSKSSRLPQRIGRSCCLAWYENRGCQTRRVPPQAVGGLAVLRPFFRPGSESSNSASSGTYSALPQPAEMITIGI